MERGGSRLKFADALLALWRLSRPEVWLVSVVPMGVGYVLAARSLFPPVERWLPLALATISLGPLAWGATLCINDVYDEATDRANARKARSPLVQGLVTYGFAKRAAYVFAVLALAIALAVSWVFALFVLACLALAWLYSVPPVRLKTRPGADVLVNAVGVGGLSAFAGWTLAGRPLAEAPWAFLPQGLLVAAAIYVPTTLVDHDADLAAGYRTFATQLGRSRAYAFGFACWVAANVGAVALSALGLILPRAMLPLLLLFAPVLVFEYHAFIGRARSPQEMVKGVILCSVTFAAVNGAFVLMHTGLWHA